MITDIGESPLDKKEASNPSRPEFIKQFFELANTFKDRNYYDIAFYDRITPRFQHKQHIGIHHEYHLEIKSSSDNKVGIYKYDNLSFYYGYYKLNGNEEYSDIVPNDLANMLIGIIEDNTGLSIQELSYDNMGYI
jgi:hypothetical protein